MPVIEHRDSLEPETSSDRLVEPRIGIPGRLADLVESSGSWRVARRRLAWYGVLGSFFLFVVPVGWTWISKAAWHWLALEPDYQLPFSKIDLIPEPPAWFRMGKAGLLEQVRADSKFGETLPILELNLDEIRAAFKCCPCVSDVTRVEKGFDRLVVHLAYRKPVAIFEAVKVIIDKDAVVLPWDDLNLVEPPQSRLVRGIPEPLIRLSANFKAPQKPTPGLCVKDDLGAQDLKILGAALLANFLADRAGSLSDAKVIPRFFAIYPDPHPEPATDLAYFLIDADDNWIYWQHAPGGEARRELTALQKWDMLVDHLRREGSFKAKGRESLHFDRSGMKIKLTSPPGRPPTAPIPRDKKRA